MDLVCRPVAALVGVCAWSHLAVADAPVATVLGDRIVDEQRSVVIVVRSGGSCTSPEDVLVAPPFELRALGRCVAELRGPLDEPPHVTVRGLPIDVDVPTGLAPAPTPTVSTKEATKGWTLDIVASSTMLPVGREAVAGYLLVTKGGAPTSDVDLHVTVDGARPRALRWIAPGVAAIDLVVARWRPSIEVVAYHGTDVVRADIHVDPGLPTDVELVVPPVRDNEVFAVSPIVRTTEGVLVSPDRVRIDVPDCATEGAGFLCPTVGPRTAIVLVNIDGAWIPIDVRRFHVDARPLVERDPTTINPLVELGVSGGRAIDGWMGGLRVGAARASTPRTDLEVDLAWRYHRRTLASEMPISNDLTLAEHELSIVGGIRHTYPRWPVTVRAVAGVAGVRSSIDGEPTMRLGLRALGVATCGFRISQRGAAIGIDLGARVAKDLRSAWPGAAAEIFVEVTLANR